MNFNIPNVAITLFRCIQRVRSNVSVCVLQEEFPESRAAVPDLSGALTHTQPGHYTSQLTLAPPWCVCAFLCYPPTTNK